MIVGSKLIGELLLEITKSSDREYIEMTNHVNRFHYVNLKMRGKALDLLGNADLC